MFFKTIEQNKERAIPLPIQMTVIRVTHSLYLSTQVLVGDVIIPAEFYIHLPARCCFCLQELNLAGVTCNMAAMSRKSEALNFDKN